MVAPLWNVGSVAEETANRVGNVPTNLSGTGMHNMVYGAITRVEETTGQSVGDSGIAVKYHEALVCLTASKLTQAKIIQDDSADGTGSAGKGYKIGDFSFSGDNYNTGDGSTLQNSKNSYDACADAELRSLGWKMNVQKSRG